MRSNGLLQEVNARLQLRMESPEVWEVRRGLSPSCSRLQAGLFACQPLVICIEWILMTLARISSTITLGWMGLNCRIGTRT